MKEIVCELKEIEATWVPSTTTSNDYDDMTFSARIRSNIPIITPSFAMQPQSNAPLRLIGDEKTTLSIR